MINAWHKFEMNMSEVRKVDAIYHQLVDNMHLSHDDFSDLLRMEIVTSISSFDSLLHDFVRIGLINQLMGIIPLKDKTKNFSIPASSYIELSTIEDCVGKDIQKHLIFTKVVNNVLKTLTFQNAEKIKDGLSYIWAEEHKWQTLAVNMNFVGDTPNDKQRNLTQQLNLYVERRNQIVHEADVDLITRQKRLIDVNMANGCINLIEKLAKRIAIDACGLNL